MVPFFWGCVESQVPSYPFDTSSSREERRARPFQTPAPQANPLKPLPPPVSAILPRQLPLRSARIVIDAGHGGRDPGASGRRGIREKDVCLDIALEAADILRSSGQSVLLTRNRDVFIELGERADFANRNAAELFVSVHANAHDSADMSGVEVYHPRWRDRSPKDRDDLRPSQELAHRINASLVREAGAPSNKVGTHQHSLAVLRKTRCPAVLVEVGYLTNAIEEANLSTREYRHRIAQAIADGILAYLDDGISRSAGQIQGAAREGCVRGGHGERDATLKMTRNSRNLFE